MTQIPPRGTPEPSMTPTEQRIVKALDLVAFALGDVYAFAQSTSDGRIFPVDRILNRVRNASSFITALLDDLPLSSPSEAPSEATAPAPEAKTGGSEAVADCGFLVGDRVRHRSTGWSGEIRFICPNGMARVLSDEGLGKDYPLTSLINLTRQASIEATRKAVDAVLDPNVEAVREMLLQRSRMGLKKYGVTTDRDDLSELDWHRHHLEELLDAAVYVMRKIRKMEGVK